MPISLTVVRSVFPLKNKTKQSKKNYDLYETYQQSLTVSIRLSFLTSVHEKEHNNRNNE